MKEFEAFLTEASRPGGASFIGGQGAPEISEDQVTVFGRHNPPHMGHGKTFDMAHRLSTELGGADQQFYTSRSQDPKKNPLPFMEKVRFLQQMFPKHAQKWDTDENVRTIIDSAKKAHEKGYKNFHYIGGDDRRQGVEDLLRRYNGNLYQFDNMYSHSAGKRDPDGDGLEGASATKLRSAAQRDDYEAFGQFMPNVKGFKPREMFDMIQRYTQQGMNEQEIRDLYHTNQIYLVGEVVESLTTGLVGEVHRRGANHLICVTEEGVMFKNFLTDVQAL